MSCSSRSALYRSAHLGILVFRRRAVGRRIGCGSTPTSEHVDTSRINARWSPMPKPIGIAQIFAMSISGVAQTASIGLDPRKYVAVSGKPVVWSMDSLRSRPGDPTIAFPNRPVYTWSLASKHTINRLPSFLHFVRRSIRSF